MKTFPFSWKKRRVDFLICGTQKGGTSALDAYLREHPQLCMANQKEVHFFDDEKHFRGGKPDYAAYHSCFSPGPSQRVMGEATPSYMYWYDAPRRIWHYNPRMKLLVVLRNPVDRAYSHWNMQRKRGIDDLSFWDALHIERERCREALPYQEKRFSYVDRGFYLEQLRRLWTYFARDQVLVTRHEDLRSKPKEAIDKIYDFLGVGPVQGIQVREVHSHEYDSPMSKREREYLQFIFEYEIRGLERLLGWDCSNWLAG